MSTARNLINTYRRQNNLVFNRHINSAIMKIFVTSTFRPHTIENYVLI